MTRHSDDPPPPGPEEYGQALALLEALIAHPQWADDDPQAYELFQAAQKYYKSVKKYRKYLRKREQAPAPRAAEAPPEPASIRFRHPEDDDELLARDALQPPEKRSRCYVCRVWMRESHPVYPAMCVACGGLNAEKREQSCDLRGRVAVVTGARVKIGYQVALKLLRCGAKVLGTTRFPKDAARRFAQEPDFSDWSHRLQLYGLDLRHIPSIDAFVEAVEASETRLDILIQNAAQTVRRPPAFFQHLLQDELQPTHSLPPALQPLLPEVTGTSASTSRPLPALLTPQDPSSGDLAARLSQVPLLPGDEEHDPDLFPPGRYDADGQQQDRRPHNSWTMRAWDVPLTELWEVMMINATAPFYLLVRLLPLLSHDEAERKFAVHVSATEGQFQTGGRKTTRHPHTNMSKAALNMFTRTCAKDFAARGLFLNSVDPGWVSLEMPYPYQMEYAQAGFRLPIDAVDGAARICDPIFTGMGAEKPEYGKLFKDYRETDW